MKIKKIFILALFFPSIFLISQELDQKYLDSLPDDMRRDILEQVDERDELDEPVYRNDSSQLKKKK